MGDARNFSMRAVWFLYRPSDSRNYSTHFDLTTSVRPTNGLQRIRRSFIRGVNRGVLWRTGVEQARRKVKSDRGKVGLGTTNHTKHTNKEGTSGVNSYYYLFKSCFLAKMFEHTRRKSLEPRELGFSQRRQDRKG
jgi:hypothetical protein